MSNSSGGGDDKTCIIMIITIKMTIPVKINYSKSSLYVKNLTTNRNYRIPNPL